MQNISAGISHPHGGGVIGHPTCASGEVSAPLNRGADKSFCFFVNLLYFGSVYAAGVRTSLLLVRIAADLVLLVVSWANLSVRA